MLASVIYLFFSLIYDYIARFYKIFTKYDMIDSVLVIVSMTNGVDGRYYVAHNTKQSDNYFDKHGAVITIAYHVYNYLLNGLIECSMFP